MRYFDSNRGLVNDVRFYTNLDINRTLIPSPRTNEVLTPVACQTLLTYTFILGESPIRLHPSFVLRCLLRWFSHADTQISAHLEHYISAHLEHYIGIIIGYVTGIYVQ